MKKKCMIAILLAGIMLLLAACAKETPSMQAAMEAEEQAKAYEELKEDYEQLQKDYEDLEEEYQNYKKRTEQTDKENKKPTSTPPATPTPEIPMEYRNALKQAKSYLDFMAFSRQGLIDQLVFEGFTAEQAEYGVTAVGY